MWDYGTNAHGGSWQSEQISSSIPPFKRLLNHGTVASPPMVHVTAFSRSNIVRVRFEQSDNWLSMYNKCGAVKRYSSQRWGMYLR